MTYQRWLRTALRTARKQGWVVAHNKHYKLRNPQTGAIVILSGSPSCPYVQTKCTRDLLRAGLAL